MNHDWFYPAPSMVSSSGDENGAYAAASEHQRSSSSRHLIPRRGRHELPPNIRGDPHAWLVTEIMSTRRALIDTHVAASTITFDPKYPARIL